MVPIVIPYAVSVGATKKDVNFYDYDGTLVASYTIAEAQVLSALPTATDHSGYTVPLTFQEWNYTLTQVNATTIPIDVGATYITTDRKTHFKIQLTTTSGLSPTLYLNKSDSSELSIDWGDLSTIDTFSNSGNFNTGAHTYSAIGDYEITMWISNGSGTYGFSNGTSSTIVVGGGTQAYRDTLMAIYIGENVIEIKSVAFTNCRSLNLITIPNNITIIYGNSFYNCYSLIFLTIPNGVTSIPSASFGGCYSLTSISIPNSVTSIGTNLFQTCTSLISATIPDGTTSIGSYMFSSDYSLTIIIIPDSVTTIASYAFYNCTSLTAIKMPSDTISIATFAFANCYSIHEYDFSDCTSVPTLESTYAFNNINSICIMKIPSALYSTWSTATNWSVYANYMVSV